MEAGIYSGFQSITGQYKHTHSHAVFGRWEETYMARTWQEHGENMVNKW